MQSSWHTGLSNWSNWQNALLYTYGIIGSLSAVLYILLYAKLWKSDPRYLQTLNIVYRLLLGTILIIFYFPFFSNTTYRKLIPNYAFASGILLLTSISVVDIQALWTVLDELRFRTLHAADHVFD
jgi:drug/metabolite transporter (DMT)-like permease